MFKFFSLKLFLLVCLAQPAIALPKRITLDHQRQAFVPHSAIGGRFGGVILINDLTSAYVDGVQVSLDELQIISHDETDGLCIIAGQFSSRGDCYFVQVSEDHLARMISFIDNEGFGVYTYFGDQNTLNATYRSAGMSRANLVPEGGLIAIEFAGDEYLEEIAYGLDFRGVSPVNLEAIRENEVLAELNGPRLPGGSALSYVVADFSTQFQASLFEGQVTVSGGLFHYDRSMDSSGDFVYYTRARLYPERVPLLQAVHEDAEARLHDYRRILASTESVTIDQISDEALADFVSQTVKETIARERLIPLADVAIQDTSDIQSVLFGVATENEIERVFDQVPSLRIQYLDLITYASQQEFAGTLALLRTVKSQNPENWENFAEGFFD
ncbi:hypothetical protein HKX54_08100 [Sulfitobacter sp. M57]|uniref:hypothetical protein n=1 Tax=unclassified Sulfitobacter TaxID=196795 RepID=UPI0023E0B339|nr:MULTISPECIES: hypothetical protein [unclassified Sulfitobacter]MDF3414413.1 hypothetical protein [Sulfitobacter sp. KE5]MDF3421894.1 hypothetical protein [Sulfitobacter sp. KE43]MDF3432959.1 hypothetical protein [Sulfitobacter sp. KE42]MDF3458599.1 hypothetical protein [Sulfitobacter sp. S74]MDF3462499.1 hypothetical protein [Sulfitobacter sp. Ks18]